MTHTEVLYDCYGVSVDNNTQEYRIEVSIETAGELPQKFIFVYAVNSKDDPSTDIFQRVGNPQDVQNLKVGRDAAIANDETEYLTSYCYLQYSTLDVAIQAKSVLTTRINDLVKYWIDYRDIFSIDNTTPKLFPTTDPSYEQSLKDAYVEARDVTAEKEADVVTKNDALDAIKVSVEQAADILPIYQAQQAFCDTILTGAFPVYTTKVVESADATTLRTGTINPAIVTFCGNATAGLATQTNQITTLNKQMEDASRAKGEADAALLAAQRAEDEALAAVYAVCPDFDPSSV
jgi:uncharacterized protein (UPF0333 family)